MTQIPISADLDIFFTDQELAQPVTVNGQLITAIITDSYEIIGVGTAEIEGSDIMLIAKTDDVPGVGHGDPVIISGSAYKVATLRPSNTGITRIKLREL